jgi:hypothetical protein
MSWIKEFTEGTFSLFSGNTPDAFQPIDFFNFYPLWYDLWIDRTAAIIKQLDLEHKSFQEIEKLLPGSSSILALPQKISVSYKYFINKNPENCKIVCDFAARMLMEGCPGDPFKSISNPCHTPEQVNQILSGTQWQTGDPIIGKALGKLIAASGSLVHGLYNDLATDYGWDTFGPYRVNHESKNYELLIRSFPDLSPGPLWDSELLPSQKTVTIYGLYEGVEWQINGVGCHTTILKGSPVTGLKKYAVIGDGKSLGLEEINLLVAELSEKAEDIYKKIGTKNFEDLKNMVMWQECYQLNKLYDAAGVDWRPTQEMLDRIKNKPLTEGAVPHGIMVSTLEQYKNLYNIRYFAKEVLDEEI